MIKLRHFFIILFFPFYSAVAQDQLDSLTIAKLLPQIEALQIAKDRVALPEIKDYTIAIIGSDNKVVIGLDGSVRQPLIDKKVNLLLKIIRKKDKAYAEIPVKDLLVNGQYRDKGVGKMPFVIPSLREWHGVSGSFILENETAIVLERGTPDNEQVADLLKQDIEKLFGYSLKIKEGTPKKGDIFIKNEADINLGEEGYALTVEDIITISAPKYKGRLFATRTILQMLGNGKINPIQKGFARDYPTYEVRGIMIDVGRKFFTIDFLNDYVEMLSYYKMSNFHIHLNDNGFKKYFNNDWDSTYAGFRLENERYPGLASKDGFYTKKEFIALQKKAEKYGITIIPEIDVPAHSLAIAHAIPEVGSRKYGMDHLDLDNPLSYEVVKNIFDEYTKGPNPVFIGEEVHIGTDEYDKSESEKFRKFTDYVIKAVQANGKKVRAWGALTHAQGNTPVTVKDVTLNMWYNGYADPIEMKKLGYPQISTPDGWLYIVPAAGYYYDYLNTDNLYNNWVPRKIGNVTFEKGDPIVRGGSFAVWNDIAGNGISEKDVHNRVFPAMQILAEKMWTAEDRSVSLYTFNQKRKDMIEAPGLNVRGMYVVADPLMLHLDFEGEIVNRVTNEWNNIIGTNTGFVEGARGTGLKFSGNASSLKLPLEEIGENYTVSFWIKPESGLNGDLFVSKHARVFYNEKGLGYVRDGYTYYFDASLPSDQWSYVSVTGDQIGTQLYLNGKLVKNMNPVDVIMPNKEPNGNEIKYKKVQTLVFPLSEVTLLGGVLDELKVYNKKLSALEVASEFSMYQ